MNLPRGVKINKHFNKYYPDGVSVIPIDMLTAKYRGCNVGSLSAQGKRKFENLLFLEAQQESRDVTKFHYV